MEKVRREIKVLLVLSSTIDKFTRYVLALCRAATSFEIFISFYAVGWAVQLIYVHNPIEPISKSLWLATRGNIPIMVHGILLLCTAIMQVIAIYICNAKLKVITMFMEMMFFIFAWYSVIFTGLSVPAVTVLPVVIAFCIGNLIYNAIVEGKWDSIQVKSSDFSRWPPEQ